MSATNGEILKLTSEFTMVSGDICQNIYHFRVNTIGSVADASIITELTDWINAVLATIDDYVHQNVSANLHSVDKVAWDGSKWAVTANIGTFTPSFTPTVSTSDALPYTVSPFIVLNTSRPKTKGRKFMWGTCEEDTTGSTMISAFVTAMVNCAAAMLLDAVIDVDTFFVPGVPRTATSDFFTFTTAVVTNILGSQRRRRPGVGQ